MFLYPKIFVSPFCGPDTKALGGWENRLWLVLYL
jgi:hypothetical protein